MRWVHWLRTLLLPLTRARAQQRVAAADRALAARRAQIASLPAQERQAHAQEIQALMTEHAHARNDLSDALDDRAKR
jgi:hypothetical protein